MPPPPPPPPPRRSSSRFVAAWLSVVGFAAFGLAWAAAPPVRVADRLPPAASRPVDFGRDVKPLLDRACVGCHGPEKQRGGLRLDVGKAALEGGNSGAVIKPGDSKASRLIH